MYRNLKKPSIYNLAVKRPLGKQFNRSPCTKQAISPEGLRTLFSWLIAFHTSHVILDSSKTVTNLIARRDRRARLNPNLCRFAGRSSLGQVVVVAPGLMGMRGRTQFSANCSQIESNKVNHPE